MLIICTQDPAVRAHAREPGSGAAAWGPVTPLTRGLDQRRADVELGGALAAVSTGPLCLSAHGNDVEIGDAIGGWTWTVEQVARFLLDNVPTDDPGPILIHACAEQVSNFSARLAVALEGSRFRRTWIYGYNRPVGARAGYPDPATLHRAVDLQGTQV